MQAKKHGVFRAKEAESAAVTGKETTDFIRAQLHLFRETRGTSIAPESLEQLLSLFRALGPRLAFLRRGFLGHRVIRERPMIDNRLDHFAYVRAQQPIDRDADKLRCVQDRASLHDCIDSLFLIWP